MALCTAGVLALLAACGGSDDPAPQPAQATLAVLATTDLHNNVRSYDYFKLAADPSYGFERTATLVRQARSEFANTLLVDNGDTLQGTARADYEAVVNPIPCTQPFSIQMIPRKTAEEPNPKHRFRRAEPARPTVMKARALARSPRNPLANFDIPYNIP